MHVGKFFNQPQAICRSCKLPAVAIMVKIKLDGGRASRVRRRGRSTVFR
jgi:hypothetical protein